MIGSLIVALALAGGPHVPRDGSIATLGPWTAKPIAAARLVPCTVVTWQLGPGEFNTITLACTGVPDWGGNIRIASSGVVCLARGWGVGNAITGWLVFNGERCQYPT